MQGVGIDAVLHGDAADPHVAFLVMIVGTRIDVIWPPGYQARFTPNLEVLDASRVVVLRGARTSQAGALPRTGTFYF